MFDLKAHCDGRWGHLLSGTGLNGADKHIPATSAMPTGLWQEPIGSFLSVWRLVAVWTGGPPGYRLDYNDLILPMLVALSLLTARGANMRPCCRSPLLSSECLPAESTYS